jgi:hypothetical protein
MAGYVEAIGVSGGVVEAPAGTCSTRRPEVDLRSA